MEPIELGSLTRELRHVPEAFNTEPVRTIENVDAKLGGWKEYYRHHVREDFSFLEHYRHLGLRELARFSFEDLCKMRHSSIFTLSDSLEKLFEREIDLEIFDKIRSSMWRWSFSRGTWNEIVDTYNNLRAFNLDEYPGFEVRLDHTPSISAFSYTKYLKLYIDGVFAFLLYYKGEHVLTIGFSVAKDRTILLAQVQSAVQRGNRALYKLPRNRLEFAINLFRRNFQGYKIYVATGESLTEKYLSDGAQQLQKSAENLRRAQEKVSRTTGDTQKKAVEDVSVYAMECEKIQEHIAQVQAARTRLTAFYQTTEQLRLGRVSLKALHLKFRPVLDNVSEESIAA